MQHTKTCHVATYLPTNNYGVLYSHCSYLFTHQIWAFYLYYFLSYEGVPKIQDGGKVFNLLKLLIISIHVPNFRFLTQLHPEIRSPLFAIGSTLAPKKWGIGVFRLDLGFSVLSGFLGILGLNLTKYGFLRHCSFSPHSWLVTFYYQFTDDTKFHGTEIAVVMIFILLLFPLFRKTSAFFIVALRSSWYVKTNKLLSNKL